MRINFLILAFALLLTSKVVIAQDSTYVSNEYAKTLALYNKAKKYNDAAVIKQSLFEILVFNPNDSSAMRSLAVLYFNNTNYTSGILVGLDFLEKYPNNEIALEIVALSYEKLMLYDKAVEYYEKLWLKTENINVQYQMAYLQYAIKRFAEALANLDMLDTKVKDEDKLRLNKSDGIVQEVPFKAAIFNLKGLIAVAQDKKEEAKEYFNKAIALAPDFEMAKKSLEALNKN